MDYKQSSEKLYDSFASEFEERTKDYLQRYILEDANLFMKNLKGKRILDLGSGPGRDANFFKEHGFSPICADISGKMVELCLQKGLEAYQMDLENLKFSSSSFDGIWAYTSLLHMPKANFPKILDNIASFLSDNGLFYLGMKEGDFEDWQSDAKYNNEKRFVSLYRDDELRKLLSGLFVIIHDSKIHLGGSTYLNYLCLKK
ncbi:MAG: class I SAM-dependent methyltransferase [Nanoarchaeota archaeon]